MSNYPLNAFHFQVEWGGTRIGFTEVTGLDIHFEPILFRDGNSKVASDQKMPGKVHFNNLILKRGVISGDHEFFDWIRTINLSAVERRDVTIKLLNEHHEPVFTWKAVNAFPIRYSGPQLNANRNDMAVEELELTHEGLTLMS